MELKGSNSNIRHCQLMEFKDSINNRFTYNIFIIYLIWDRITCILFLKS